MILNMIGTDGESETVIRVKLWPIISLIIIGMVSMGLYLANHESRLCVTEKATDPHPLRGSLGSASTGITASGVSIQ